MLYLFIAKFIAPYLLLSLGLLPSLSHSSGAVLGEENCQQEFLPVNSEKSLPRVLEPPPEINSANAAVLATDVNFWLYEKAAQDVRPIASISKLMTALVFLETEPDWQDYYTIVREDNVSGGRLNLFLGDTLTIRDLFYTALISSDNGAATALVRSTGLSEEDFITKMNDQARAMSLFSTQFVDVTGLSDANLSTAKDVIRLAKLALNTDEIVKALELEEHRFITKQGREKLIVSTANGLLQEPANGALVIGGKTGYTEEAGYCFVGRYFDENNREVISVVLGADSRHDRFKEASLLATWAFINCDW